MKTPLKYLLNPCDIERHEILAPLGDFLAKFSPECPCCSTVRWALITIAAFSLGYVL